MTNRDTNSQNNEFNIRRKRRFVDKNAKEFLQKSKGHPENSPSEIFPKCL